MPGLFRTLSIFYSLPTPWTPPFSCCPPSLSTENKSPQWRSLALPIPNPFGLPTLSFFVLQRKHLPFSLNVALPCALWISFLPPLQEPYLFLSNVCYICLIPSSPLEPSPSKCAQDSCHLENKSPLHSSPSSLVCLPLHRQISTKHNL